MKIKVNILPMWLVNSSLWYHLYYKHTKEHKKDRKETTNRVLEIRKKAIGR